MAMALVVNSGRAMLLSGRASSAVTRQARAWTPTLAPALFPTTMLTQSMATSTPPGHKVGTVVSNKMDKSIVVQVDRRHFHPLLKHYVKRRKKFMAHDEHEVAMPGDVVQISPSRPRSKKKRWNLEDVLKKADTME